MRLRMITRARAQPESTAYAKPAHDKLPRAIGLAPFDRLTFVTLRGSSPVKTPSRARANGTAAPRKRSAAGEGGSKPRGRPAGKGRTPRKRKAANSDDDESSEV